MAKDVLKAVRLILVNRTSAADRVATTLGQTLPAIRYRHDGGGGLSEDNRIQDARVVFEAWARAGSTGHAQAYALALEIRDVLLPPERVVHGYKGTAGDVYVSDVRLESGPSWVPDPATGEARYVSSYRFIFY